jgi:ABC-2 type transport system ATP-binding protein
LQGVDLTVHQGEFFGLLGPNGAGKSTLMKILSGFLKADSGKVFIQGIEVGLHDQSARRRCGLVPQEIALYESLNPLENLRIFARLYEIPRKQAETRGEELLNAVGLWDRRHDRVKEFSGGMKRRLNIILSLLHDPEILFCDEPTVGVDPQSRNAIFSFLEARNKEGLTILYTTHYMEEAERLCPRISIIDHGKILACGAQDELLRDAGCEREVMIRKGPGIEAFLDVARSHGNLLEEDLRYRLIPDASTRLSVLYSALEAAGLPYDQMEVRAPSLESLFLQLTGHRLRD